MSPSIDKGSRSSKDHDPETIVSAVHEQGNVYRPEVDVSGIDERKVLRKIDWHVVPWLAVLYLLNFLDRGSIGNARVSVQTQMGVGWPLADMFGQKLYNMQTDLHMTDNQYLIALTVFFFPYSLFEVRNGTPSM